MKALFVAFALLTAFLAYRVVELERQVSQLQINTAIAVLSAEAANNKIGATSPFFRQDKQAFVNAWLDANNLPQAVFPDEVLHPIKRNLELMRSSKQAQSLVDSIFK
jgi:hypothetical protein